MTTPREIRSLQTGCTTIVPHESQGWSVAGWIQVYLWYNFFRIGLSASKVFIKTKPTRVFFFLRCGRPSRRDGGDREGRSEFLLRFLKTNPWDHLRFPDLNAAYARIHHRPFRLLVGMKFTEVRNPGFPSFAERVSNWWKTRSTTLSSLFSLASGGLFAIISARSFALM